MNQYHIIAISALAAFVISLVFGPAMIRYLHKLKFGQFIREEGPESHQKKSGTPTMGGVLFIAALIVATLPFAGSCPKVIPVLLVTVGFALVGFLDDYIKVVKKRNLGLTEVQKMAGQIVITAAFAIYMVKFSGVGTQVIIPFTNGYTWDMGILYVPVLFFVVLGTVNGSNFTDGLDGLASSVTVVIALFLTVISVISGTDITPVTAAMMGALLGFLWFNTHPAQVFMGDTGSLALGGFVVSCCYILQIPFFIPLIALIYLVEVLSVIIQVSYYKKTKKRVFKMAPIHHHFELSGWPETKVVSIFMIVTAVTCLIAFFAY